MKGLDTPILVGLLRGEGRVTSALRRWEGDELCTTSINLYELEAIARSDRSPGRDRRLAAVERLRRKVTILPFDERSARIAALEASKGDAASTSPASWVILGSLLASGCTEWVTTRDANFPTAESLKVTILGGNHSKKL